MKLQWSLSLMGLELVNKKLEFLPLHSMPMQEPISHHHIFRCIISGIPPLMTFTSGGPPKTNPWPKERWCRKKENEKYVNERGMNTFLGEIFVALFFLSDANSWLEYHYPKIILRSTSAMKTSKRDLNFPALFSTLKNSIWIFHTF